MSSDTLTPEQLHVLRHALGVGTAGTDRAYRNHFVTGSGGTDHVLCTGLVEAGMMIRHSGTALSGGDDVFTVTELGRTAAVTVAVVPPLSRSKRRYQAYLQSDSNVTFIDWLRTRNGSTRHGR
ncbi:hypothetical protein K7574_21190 (plasmid) [Stenotrophomonas maltophilia]|uniref:hypothetical protein n=1 Tax=Stenotrophomonas maltophilia TaxID=40324 RepID=UPI001D0C7B2A|nr:hypothetical protein [Stenotrophomonas maltophilia]UXF74611.1 hypothetical protein K7574_21190 [Stenotrophomonas maltophilia]